MNRQEIINKREKVRRLQDKVTEVVLARKCSCRRWSRMRAMMDTLRCLNIQLEQSLFSGNNPDETMLK